MYFQFQYVNQWFPKSEIALCSRPRNHLQPPSPPSGPKLPFSYATPSIRGGSPPADHPFFCFPFSHTFSVQITTYFSHAGSVLYGLEKGCNQLINILVVVSFYIYKYTNFHPLYANIILHNKSRVIMHKVLWPYYHTSIICFY